MSWAEVKRLNRNLTKYDLSILQHVYDYKLHGEKSYVFKNKKILHKIYTTTKISLYDEYLLNEAFSYNLENNGMSYLLKEFYGNDLGYINDIDTVDDLFLSRENNPKFYNEKFFNMLLTQANMKIVLKSFYAVRYLSRQNSSFYNKYPINRYLLNDAINLYPILHRTLHGNGTRTDNIYYGANVYNPSTYLNTPRAGGTHLTEEVNSLPNQYGAIVRITGMADIPNSSSDGHRTGIIAENIKRSRIIYRGTSDEDLKNMFPVYKMTTDRSQMSTELYLLGSASKVRIAYGTKCLAGVVYKFKKNVDI